VEKLRDQRHTTDNTQPFRVTASIGLATHMEGDQHFATVGDLLNAADQALYAAKHGGRDQVIAYAALN
jgi:PleD family two-component response regulator